MSVHESFEWEQPELHESYEWEQPELHESYEWEQPELHEAYELSGELHESLELELAQELLEITNEAELEEFLGKLVRGVARGASSFMKSGVGKAVGGVLRNVAKTALPMVGSALGSFVAPGLGTAIGGKLGSMAAKLLEAEERETMGEAEAELEAARRYVRWANGTVRSAMRAPYGVAPRLVARSAAVSSARRYAPTLLRQGQGRGRQAYGRQGQWRARRAPRWDAPAWDPSPSAPSQGCRCGRGTGGDGGFEPFDDDDASAMESLEAFETVETHESQESQAVGGPAGRWYRRGNRIVLVGA
ncbi:hypothetical protein SFC79_16920 [Nocardioides sp. S-58]|uniref:Uncharacterized protein n=1 Tax=Nocardioides renjunii TaxID=3095075 RepID=A0ABU5KF59_9ACTN|nr:hypothetical protein [Nocardioides sp. S-58]MDZ5663458.1 hypothetical protein [Nocardioides sp. S-58]